jgi:hypothetical protein
MGTIQNRKQSLIQTPLLVMKSEDIINAWAWVRKNNQSIPDDVLDLMKDAAIEKLSTPIPDTDGKEQDYWKERCEAAEAVIDKFAAIPLHPDVTESGKTIFKQWQELKSTPIPILTPCGGWIDGNILPKEPGLYVCICEENKDGIKTQRATFGEFRLHYDKIFVNEDLYGKVIKWYNDESPSPSDRERIDYWQKLYSESESKLSDAKTEIERLKGFIAEVAIFHHDANPSKLIEKARKLI